MTDPTPMEALRARHVKTLNEMFAECANYRRMQEADALTFAIEALATPGAGPVEGAGARGALACTDCGMAYGGDCWADFVVPDDEWQKISSTGSPAEALCVQCMIIRANRLGVQCVGQFTSGPFADSDWRKPVSTPSTPAPVAVESATSRFFIDHGVIHDRKTGKHVALYCDEPDCVLALLHELENDRDAWRMTARAFSVPAPEAAAQVTDAVQSVCKWWQQDEGYDTFSTSCGHEYTVNDCTDGNVQLPFCPFCAKNIEGSAWTPDDGAALRPGASAGEV